MVFMRILSLFLHPDAAANLSRPIRSKILLVADANPGREPREPFGSPSGLAYL